LFKSRYTNVRIIIIIIIIIYNDKEKMSRGLWALTVPDLT